MTPKDDYIDYGAVRINSKGKYQLNMAYTEITRLHTLLEDNRIPHLFRRFYDGWQVCYPDSENAESAQYSTISLTVRQTTVSKSWAVSPPADGTADSVLGHLTAEDVFARIVTMHKAASTYENADRCVCCGDVIPEGRQVCPGCEGGEPT